MREIFASADLSRGALCGLMRYVVVAFGDTKVTYLALGLSYDCHFVSEANLNDMHEQ